MAPSRRKLGTEWATPGIAYIVKLLLQPSVPERQDGWKGSLLYRQFVRSSWFFIAHSC